MPGTPAWHKRHLQDLVHMVKVFGMPHLFLTLTCDEVSEMKWQEIVDLEEFLKSVASNLSFQDCPVECAKLFHDRLWAFLHKFIIKPSLNGQRSPGLLGRVSHYVVRYEVQSRHSLHAHIVLWIDEADVEKVSSEIIAYVPAIWDKIHRQWIMPDDPIQAEIVKLVLRKQLHKCRPTGCQSQGKCQYGFPYPPQPAREPKYNNKTKKYDYCRFGFLDRNVVPYHPLVLLYWGAHMNLQLITNEAWSFYLLKYSMKAEPIGKIDLSLNMKESLGLSQVAVSQMKTYYAMYAARPMSISEVALNMLDISTVHRDVSVLFIPTAPPQMRMRPVNTYTQQGYATYVSCIDKYMARPSSCTNVNFYTYYTKYNISKQRLTSFELVGVDDLGNFVHRYPDWKVQLVRFTDYHPAHNMEAFFYNVLLKHVAFHTEANLISADNVCGSYLLECYLRGLLQNEDDMLQFITVYCTDNLYTKETQQSLLNTMMSTAIGDFLTTPDPNVSAFPINDVLQNIFGDVANDVQQNQTSFKSFSDEFADVLHLNLNPEQLNVFTSIATKGTGVHAISGVPGAGKTLLAKAITLYFDDIGKSVMLAATTGPAASRISKRAQTVHASFLIPAYGQLPYLPPSHTVFQRIMKADVILIDEYSMMTATMFNMVLFRVRNVCSTAQVDFNSKLIILLGDPAQLPPVCKHRKDDDDICAACHISASHLWSHIHKHHLATSMRHVADPEFVLFLGAVRVGKVNQATINAVLGCRMYSLANAATMIDANTTVICTHRQDVYDINNVMLPLRCTDCIQVHMSHNCHHAPEMTDWLKEPHFHVLNQVAIGATVMLTQNLDLTIGACNGAVGTITAFKHNAAGDISGITITLDNTSTITVYRMAYKFKYFAGKRFYKATWPLSLAYAMTGHKCQGATIKGRVLLYIRDIFCPGLLYVMLSRVLQRSQLVICGELKEAMFKPVPSQYLQ